MDRYLIVVSRQRSELVQELTRRHLEAGEVEVILDRRERGTAPPAGIERRAPLRLDTDLGRQAFVVIQRSGSPDAPARRPA